MQASGGPHDYNPYGLSLGQLPMTIVSQITSVRNQ